MQHPLAAGVLALGCLIAVFAPHAGAADAYPSQPVRFVVPLGPGSGADTNTRVLAERFQAIAGVPAVVDNKPGADLIVGTQSALNAPADGHTVLLITPSAMVINPLFVESLPYDPAAIRPVLHLTSNVGVLVTAADSPFAGLDDVVQAARARPEAVSMGLYGNTYRLGARVFAREAGVRFNEIPYKGFGPTVADVVGGTVDVAFVDLGGALPLIESGKLKALAVGSDERLDVVPDLPTFRESGFADYSLYIFVGYGVRADTPEPVVSELERLLLEAAAHDGVRTALTRQAGTLYVGEGGERFAAFIDEEVRKARLAMGR